VKDKLLNTLQLRDQVNGDPRRRELIEASIAQRSREAFTGALRRPAIDLRRNRRHLRYAVPPLLLLCSFFAPRADHRSHATAAQAWQRVHP
jgi:hypothetical protein